MPTINLTLIIPGIFESLAKGERKINGLKSLETLLVRSDKEKYPADSLYQCMLDLFDIDPSGPAYLPVAALSRFSDTGKRDPGIWMHIDPLYLEADKDRLISRGNSILDISNDEATVLIDLLNQTYVKEGWYFESCHANRWYVQIRQQPESEFSAPTDVLGRNIETFLPKGNDQMDWHRFINEVQMLFHSSTVNQQRMENGVYPINSIWCWGAGPLPEQVSTGLDRVYANVPFVKGLAMLSGCEHHSLPENAHAVIKSLARSEKDTDCLVVMEPTEEDILSLDFEHYKDKLNMLEHEWFQPLVQGMEKGYLSSLSLLACNGLKYALKKNNLRRFWRRRKAI